MILTKEHMENVELAFQAIIAEAFAGREPDHGTWEGSRPSLDGVEFIVRYSQRGVGSVSTLTHVEMAVRNPGPNRPYRSFRRVNAVVTDVCTRFDTKALVSKHRELVTILRRWQNVRDRRARDRDTLFKRLQKLRRNAGGSDFRMTVAVDKAWSAEHFTVAVHGMLEAQVERLFELVCEEWPDDES